LDKDNRSRPLAMSLTDLSLSDTSIVGSTGGGGTSPRASEITQAFVNKKRKKKGKIFILFPP